LKTRAYAKVNLLLKVLGVRKDGYHDLQMLMHTISLFDELTITRSKSGVVVKLKNSVEDINQEENIVYKIAQFMVKKYCLPGGLKIILKKNIPIGAGLGGGSSDGAAVIDAIDYLYKLNLSYRQKVNIAKIFGADIPFFIKGGFSELKGIGDKVKKLTTIKKFYMVIIKPSFSISTASVYLNVENYGKKIKIPVKLNTIKDIYPIMTNDLTEPAMKAEKKLANYLKKLRQSKDIKYLLTGSGSAIVVYFDNKKSRNAFYKINYNTYKKELIKADSINFPHNNFESKKKLGFMAFLSIILIAIGSVVKIIKRPK